MRTARCCGPYRVDLRVGGGTSVRVFTASGQTGRSPRGRRNQCPHNAVAIVSRSISAWAEEPVRLRWSRGMAGVDLRVGGGTRVMMEMQHSVMGRSPRGRRNRFSYRKSPD